jgi:molybdate transport system substrate-binding protein
MTRRLACLLLAALLLSARPAAAQELLVFAAASLKTALDEFHATLLPGTRASYAASPALARQIESGAPADIFISADLDWMEYLAERKLLKPGTATALLGNTLVLVAPAASAATAGLRQGAPLSPLLGADGRLAVADTASVPAGKYARAALISLGLWDDLSPRLAQTENVRAALALVARGETPLGIVYGSDAASEKGVKVLAEFPAASHPAIVYPAAVTALSRHPRSNAYLAMLRSPQAAGIFARSGFVLLPAEARIN